MGKGFALTVGSEGHRRGAAWVPHALCRSSYLAVKTRGHSKLLGNYEYFFTDVSFPLTVLQLRQLFGNAVPAFPPKFYLVMTKSMADERRSQLEEYLQNGKLGYNNLISFYI